MSPCGVESCPTPGDNRGITSPSVSISGVPSPFMVFTLSSYLVLGLLRLFFPLISPSTTPFSIPRHYITTKSCSMYLKAACSTLDSSVHSGLMFSNYEFVSPSTTLITRLQHHISNASTFFLSAFLIVQVSALFRIIGNTKTFNTLAFGQS